MKVYITKITDCLWRIVWVNEYGRWVRVDHTATLAEAEEVAKPE